MGLTWCNYWMVQDIVRVERIYGVDFWLKW
jgi:hypothetical protein